MTRFFAAIFFAILFSPSFLWAAEARIFEFDYDSQPLNKQPPPGTEEAEEPSPLDLLFMPAQENEAAKPPVKSEEKPLQLNNENERIRVSITPQKRPPKKAPAPAILEGGGGGPAPDAGPRHRFWKISSRLWNLPLRAIPQRAKGPRLIDLREFPLARPLAVNRAEPVDLKKFPRNLKGSYKK